MATQNETLDAEKCSSGDEDHLSTTEVQEVMSYLPGYDGKVVILIGSNTRLYAGVVAERASTVVTVTPRGSCHHSENTKLDTVANDLQNITVAEKSVDLLLYDHHVNLTKEDHQTFLRQSLPWIRENGYLFYLQSITPDKENNEKCLSYVTSATCRACQPDVMSTTCRACQPDVTSTTCRASQSDDVFGYDIVLIKPVGKSSQSTQRNKTHRKMVWLLQKVRRKLHKGTGYASLYEILNDRLYTKVRIRQLERIFGRTFMSAGGLTTTKEFLKKLSLHRGQKVLDVGCGIGGNAFYMAKEFGVKVVAMDLSSNMIDIARERAKEVGVTDETVDFEVADATKREYPRDSFDVIFSRDTILHISGKLQLFQKFKTFLKPGGKVLISDYCCSEGEHTQPFKDYVRTFGYSVLSQREYCSTLADAGFVKIETENKTDLFIKTTTQELDRLMSQKTKYIEDFSFEDYEAFTTMWRNTQKCAAVGDQILGLFFAEKPLSKSQS